MCIRDSGCGAQNKNNIVVQTLLYFLGTHTCSVEEIQITFAIMGHSFLPADRVFGRVEKKLRKKPTIANREEYYSVYEEVGEVTRTLAYIEHKEFANSF